MMARLLEAVRPQARLVLVGDPRQLTSVGAGAVLSDLVAGYDGDPASPVVSLTENFRSTEDIKALAEALRGGDADDVLAALRAPSAEVEFVETDDPAAALPRRRGPLCAGRPQGGRGRGRRGRRRARSTTTACSVPTARDPTAYATGTGRSSSGWARRPGRRSGPSGTPAARCW